MPKKTKRLMDLPHIVNEKSKKPGVPELRNLLQAITQAIENNLPQESLETLKNQKGILFGKLSSFSDLGTEEFKDLKNQIAEKIQELNILPFRQEFKAIKEKISKDSSIEELKDSQGKLNDLLKKLPIDFENEKLQKLKGNIEKKILNLSQKAIKIKIEEYIQILSRQFEELNIPQDRHLELFSGFKQKLYEISLKMLAENISELEIFNKLQDSIVEQLYPLIMQYCTDKKEIFIYELLHRFPRATETQRRVIYGKFEDLFDDYDQIDESNRQDFCRLLGHFFDEVTLEGDNDVIFTEQDPTWKEELAKLQTQTPISSPSERKPTITVEIAAPQGELIDVAELKTQFFTSPEDIESWRELKEIEERIKEIVEGIKALSKTLDSLKDADLILLEIEKKLTSIYKSKSKSQLVVAKSLILRHQLTDIRKKLFIQRKITEITAFLNSLNLLETQKPLLIRYQELLNQELPNIAIKPEQTPDEQDELFEQAISQNQELLKIHIQLKESINQKLLDLRQQYLVKSDRHKFNSDGTREPLSLEEQTESVLNYIVENTKFNQDNNSPIDWFKRNLSSHLRNKKLIPSDEPQEPLATFSLKKLLQIKKDLDNYLHPKLEINESLKNSLTKENLESLGNAMQTAIDANGQDLMLNNKWCKLNILKIIKHHFLKKEISTEERLFYLKLFLITAGTHRNTVSIFRSTGSETASIQAFKKSLSTCALANEPLQNFITSEIGDVLNEDKQLRKGLFS